MSAASATSMYLISSIWSPSFAELSKVVRVFTAVPSLTTLSLPFQSLYRMRFPAFTTLSALATSTTLLRAIGLEETNDIIKLFGDNEALKNTLAKDDDQKIKSAKAALVEIFKKMKPGEPVTEEGTINFLVQRFFDEKRYDLGRAGRYKFIKKLGIYNRLAGRTLAENLVSADGEIRFKKEMDGVTVYSYIMLCRMRRFADLLATTDYSIMEISEMCGTLNYSNVSRIFKKTYGCSPSEYRALKKAEKA